MQNKISLSIILTLIWHNGTMHYLVFAFTP